MTDFTVGDTFDIKFTTRRFTTGAPYTLAGTPSVAAYPDNSTTEITAGITLSVDFDGLTGLNNVRVVATSGNGYASGSSYSLVITAGTVDSVSVVGEVVGEFTLGRNAAFARLGAPAGASVSADMAAVKTDSAAIKVQTDKLTFTVANQIDANVLDWKSSTAPAMTGDAYARLGAPAGASVSADVAAIKAETAAIVDDTGTSGVVVAAGSKTGYALTSSYDFAKGTVAMTESYAADGAAPTPAQALFMIQQKATEMAILGTTMTVNKLDGTTPAATFTLDSATAPTAITRAT